MRSLSTRGAKARIVERSSSGVSHFLNNRYPELNGCPKSASSAKVVESKLTKHHKNESIQGRDRHRFLTWNWRRHCQRLASDGLAAVVNYAGRAADAENIVQEIRAAGGLWP
jgi:hypothetical protein